MNTMIAMAIFPVIVPVLAPIIAVALGIAGFLIGLLIPAAANHMIMHKVEKTQKTLPNGYKDLRKQSFLLRCFICILNACFWAFAGYALNTEGSFYHILASVFLSILCTTAILIAIIDLKIRIIPNELVLITAAAGLLFQIAYFGPASLPAAGLSMIALMFLFTAVAGFIGFGKVGAGDVKFAGAMGLALGYPNIVTALVVMSATLFLYSLVGLITKRLTMKSTFPFAPFMTAGMCVSLICIASGFTIL